MSKDNLIIKVAILYYEARLPKGEIAKRLNISRPTVNKLLEKALDTGIVTISIRDSSVNPKKQAEIISERYNLQTVIISNEIGSTKQKKEDIGKLCAEFLEEHLSNYRTIGIGWGTTMYEFVQAAAYIDGSYLTVVPLMGGIGINDVKYHSNHLAFQLAEKYGANVQYFYAPALAENQQTYDLFTQLPLVKDIYTMGQSVDLAITGVGNPIESSTYRKLGYISQKERDEIKHSAAIGDILGSFFNRSGEIVKTSISSRMIGITLDDLEMVKETLIFGVGKEKTESFKALLNKGFVDHLIIDKDIADGLIENYNK